MGQRVVSPETMEKRLRQWEREGRRCDGNNRHCKTNAATRELTVVDIDDQGNEVGEERTVKLCSRHHSVYERMNLDRFRITAARRIAG